MSRGFVKEDDQEDVPIVPPRADLPAGLTNYVTQAGYDELLAEKEELISEREGLDMANEKERRIAVNHINSKLQLLNARIASAHVIDLSAQPQDEVRFGATVTFRINSEKKERKYQIVGVDEADVSKGKIAFTSPIAKALTNKKAGETAVLKLPKEERQFEIVAIDYA
jgi:transcription elongation factor GreB